MTIPNELLQTFDSPEELLILEKAWEACVAQSLNIRFPKQKKALWVTVNFDDDTTSEIALDLASKISQKKWVEKYSYSLEQRACYPEPFKGFHIHMLLETSKFKSQAQNEIFVTVKKHVGNKRHVHIVSVKDDRIYNDKMEYLLGNKWDEEKQPKIANDRLMRMQLEIPNVFSS